MPIDMNQFYQIFFEESSENLASMESLLLAIDLDAPDEEKLNAIFRAAHSIKGGSGTFGFSDMAGVTHKLETLLDGIRKNEIKITSEMVGAFLQAGDVLKGLLAGHRNGTVADPVPSVKICAKLAQLAGSHSTSGGKQNTEHMAATAQKTVAPPLVHYKIEFSISPAIFPGKEGLDNLLEDLGKLGRIEKQKIAEESVKLTLISHAPETELREIFAFFLHPDQFTIETIDDQRKDVAGSEDGQGVELVAINPDEEDGYGFFVEVEKEPQANGHGNDAAPDDAMVPAGITPLDNLSASELAQADNSQICHASFSHLNPDGITGHSTEPTGGQVAGHLTRLGGEAVESSREFHVKAQPQPDEIHRQVSDKAQSIAASAETSIRVGVGKVDQLINLVGELMITKSILAEIISNLDPVSNEPLISVLAQLEFNTSELQEAVMSVRMMPINFVFSRFPRLVHDLAVKLDKKVQFRMIGEGTELDKGLIEKISDPLIHLVRNCMDHGIESPQERIAKGKDPQGAITMSAAHQGGNIVIKVVDDGAGLSRKRILAKAREKGIPFNENISDTDVWQMIYAPGFSTATEVTDVSGRGVGMDVVKRDIESIGGRVEILSNAESGSTFTIRLPLTLAILDGLSIAVGDQFYIIPLNFIIESLQPRPEDIKEISGHGPVLYVRGEYLPLIALHKIFGIHTKVINPEEGILVLLEAEGKKAALLVDNLLSQHQVVIKSLETNYRKVVGISGATIMGDGRVAMILDVGALVKLAL